MLIKNGTSSHSENDQLGGHDPYSASKAAVELAVASWRSSFVGNGGHQTPYLAIATARAGNVIGEVNSPQPLSPRCHACIDK